MDRAPGNDQCFAEKVPVRGRGREEEGPRTGCCMNAVLPASAAARCTCNQDAQTGVPLCARATRRGADGDECQRQEQKRARHQQQHCDVRPARYRVTEAGQIACSQVRLRARRSVRRGHTGRPDRFGQCTDSRAGVTAWKYDRGGRAARGASRNACRSGEMSQDAVTRCVGVPSRKRTATRARAVPYLTRRMMLTRPQRPQAANSSAMVSG